MIEHDFDKLVAPPLHEIQAQIFTKVLDREVIPHHREVNIVVLNRTDFNLTQFPAMIRNAIAERNSELVSTISLMDSETDKESAYITRIELTLKGSNWRLLGKAVREISGRARGLHGRKTEDVRQSPVIDPDAIGEIYLHDPSLIEGTLFQRNLVYIFGRLPKQGLLGKPTLPIDPENPEGA